MGKMTFPLLKQGCLELTSVQRRETDVGRCWMRRTRNRPGTAWASRVCSRNRPEPTGFESSVTNFRSYTHVVIKAHQHGALKTSIRSHSNFWKCLRSSTIFDSPHVCKSEWMRKNLALCFAFRYIGVEDDPTENQREGQKPRRRQAFLTLLMRGGNRNARLRNLSCLLCSILRSASPAQKDASVVFRSDHPRTPLSF
jgi:hypothetical protein